MSSTPISGESDTARTISTPATRIRSWLLTTDHKRIAISISRSVTFFFFIGGIFAATHPARTAHPGRRSGAGRNLQQAVHHAWHDDGVFLSDPSIPAIFGNFLVPIMIGARDLAFPRINLLSWYIYIAGGILTLYAIIVAASTPAGLSTRRSAPSTPTPMSCRPALGIFIAGFSSILTGLNFIVTIHKMRAPGMTWFRLPLFLWAIYATSLIQVLATPIIAITLRTGGAGADLPCRHFRSRCRRRSRFSSSTCSGSTRIRPSTS